MSRARAVIPPSRPEVQPLDALGEPVRRRILEVIGVAEIAAGAIAEELRRDRGLSQPAISQHLKVLRECGLVTVRVAGTSRLYRIDFDRLDEAAAWFDQFTSPWQQPLDALATELARGRRERRAGRVEAPPGDARTEGRSVS